MELVAHRPSKSKSKPISRNTAVVSVSLEPELHEEAKARARALGMTVSMLIRQLLRRDIALGGDLTSTARPEPED